MTKVGRFVIDIADLLARPGSTKNVRAAAEVQGLAVGMSRVVPGTEVVLDVRLDSVVEGIHASGIARAEVSEECRRCLTGRTREASVAVDELFPASPDEGGYGLTGASLDLEPLVRDAVLLALPLDPLCRDDCRGLCPVCGEDRNQVSCGHEAAPTDVRWAPLGALRKKMTED